MPSQKKLSADARNTGTQSVSLGVGAFDLRSETRFMGVIKHMESFPGR